MSKDCNFVLILVVSSEDLGSACKLAIACWQQGANMLDKWSNFEGVG